MIVRSAALVVTEEENGIRPLRTGHEAIYNIRYLRLTLQNRLSRTWMLIVVAVACFNKCKAGKRLVSEITEISGQRGNVSGIDAKGIRRIADRAGLLCGSFACRAARVLVQILIRIGQVSEVGRRVLQTG